MCGGAHFAIATGSMTDREAQTHWLAHGITSVPFRHKRDQLVDSRGRVNNIIRKNRRYVVGIQVRNLCDPVFSVNSNWKLVQRIL